MRPSRDIDHARAGGSTPGLRSNLSFCLVAGRPVFLDLAADRYFCLSGTTLGAWSAFASGSPSPADLARLAQEHLIEDTGHACRPSADAIATRSLLETPAAQVSLPRLARLAWTLSRTQAGLRRKGLAAMASALDRVRSVAPPRDDLTPLVAIAQDFARLGLLTGAHDRCLARSLALGFHLAREGFAPSIVLAVRLDPFRAHCWVECRGQLANDNYERVRHYTPIRRL